ncbi:hypothetical protein EVAR_18149_1 [Eumeta japonica]|uniref:Uncharacterized protein n=1 Tax=Eumeta variegata TaxID=151549 RepID=A0A4C1UVT9_EUMVA|nr:hypothetical protein EVAR_18149_1 [Eumeta japonica]
MAAPKSALLMCHQISQTPPRCSVSRRRRTPEREANKHCERSGDSYSRKRIANVRRFDKTKSPRQSGRARNRSAGSREKLPNENKSTPDRVAPGGARGVHANAPRFEFLKRDGAAARARREHEASAQPSVCDRINYLRV